MSSLFKTPKAPQPVRMPDTEDPAAEEARRRKALEAMQRGGRASTVLSGDTYSGNTLGTA